MIGIARTRPERIALVACYQNGQIERSNAADVGYGRRHHYKVVDSLHRKGLVQYINRSAAVLTERGYMVAEKLVKSCGNIEVERQPGDVAANQIRKRLTCGESPHHLIRVYQVSWRAITRLQQEVLEQRRK